MHGYEFAYGVIVGELVMSCVVVVWFWWREQRFLKGEE